MKALLCLAVLAVAACGVDGPPAPVPAPGVAVAGDAYVGMRWDDR